MARIPAGEVDEEGNISYSTEIISDSNNRWKVIGQPGAGDKRYFYYYDLNQALSLIFKDKYYRLEFDFHRHPFVVIIKTRKRYLTLLDELPAIIHKLEIKIEKDPNLFWRIYESFI